MLVTTQIQLTEDSTFGLQDIINTVLNLAKLFVKNMITSSSVFSIHQMPKNLTASVETVKLEPNNLVNVLILQKYLTSMELTTNTEIMHAILSISLN